MDCGCSLLPAAGVDRLVSSPRGGGRKVLLFVLADDMPLQTDGAQVYRTVVVRAPADLARLGPFIEKVRVHWVGSNFSTNFQARVISEYSVNGEIWSAPSEILPGQLADGQVVGNYFTTDNQFSLNMRYSIQTQNEAGTSIETGRVTAVLEVVLKS